MSLVSYSDSEDSETEGSVPAPVQIPPTTTRKPATLPSSRPTFQKSTEQPRKIKVDLPTTQSESLKTDGAEEPPAKKARTAGAFSGFNSLLPAPKRTAAQNAPKAGVNLKTSGEAAFSRVPAQDLQEDQGVRKEKSGTTEPAHDVSEIGSGGKTDGEVKVVGKATKFRPLSVANKRKPIAKKPKEGSEEVRDQPTQRIVVQERAIEDIEGPAPKPKRSLFSVPHQDVLTTEEAPSGTYESLTTSRTLSNDYDTPPTHPQSTPNASHSHTQPNTLHSLTSNLNLTPSQRRQIFGRNHNPSDIQLTHFNMEAEYAANEQLRQAGEVIEHRAVKAIAPGKHSLQQLVNNARSQQDAMEDKWAAGRRERGEAGGRYGWK